MVLYCCVVDCNNTSTNSQCKFYNFPKAAWKLDQRNKWIAAVDRINVDGSPWIPKFNEKICSDHFIGGKKADEQASPSYVPTIFPEVYRQQKINKAHALAKYTYKVLLKRRKRHVTDTTLSEVSDATRNEITMIEENEITIKEKNDITIKENELYQTQPSLVNRGCQVNILPEMHLRETTFICNTFIYTDYCDAEIQKLANLRFFKLIENCVPICQSVISYSILIWGGAVTTNMIILEKAQRSVLKVLLKKPIRFSIISLYKILGVLTVRGIFIL